MKIKKSNNIYKNNKKILCSSFYDNFDFFIYIHAIGFCSALCQHNVAGSNNQHLYG